jgi:hypothetical protein
MRDQLKLLAEKYLNKQSIVYYRAANGTKHELNFIIEDVNELKIRGKVDNSEEERVFSYSDIIDIYPAK